MRNISVLLTGILFFVFLTTPSQHILQATPLTDDDNDEEVDPDFEERFNEALAKYEETEYLEAARLFAKLDEVEATLFAGKSYFAAGYYALALRYLTSVTEEAPAEVYLDARYTLALADFKIGNYGRSLDVLYTLLEESEIQDEADELYTSILHFLNKDQRKKAFHESGTDSVRYDLIEYALEFNSPTSVRHLTEAVRHSFDAQVDSARIEKIQAKADTLYEERGDTTEVAPAPPGMVYNVGIPLPAYDPDDSQFPVAQGLYFGIQKAADEFNQRNEDRQISLHHEDPDDEDASPESVLSKFAWNFNSDLIIGPLYSESAYKMTRDVEDYGIPMVPPLANSDTLNLDNPYIYQTNPTFAKRGRALARFAVQELEMDTLAVMTERDTQGMEEAYAFRDEAERQGAKVIHFFQDHFVDRGYDVSDYTPHFAGDDRYLDDDEKEDVIIRDIDGLFLGFTGRGAQTLIDLVMTDLEATRSEVAVLGSSEMANFNFSDRRINNFDIFFMDFMYLDDERSRVKDFKEEFEDETGMEPSQFSYLGYDVADFLFKTLEEHPNPKDLKRVIRDRPHYEGLIIDIVFANSHINTGMNFFELTEDGPVFIGEKDLEELVEELAEEEDDEDEDTENDNEN